VKDSHILKVVISELVMSELIVFIHHTVCDYLCTLQAKAAVDQLKCALFSV
jgi:hypothetical protein